MPKCDKNVKFNLKYIALQRKTVIVGLTERLCSVSCYVMQKQNGEFKYEECLYGKELQQSETYLSSDRDIVSCLSLGNTQKVSAASYSETTCKVILQNAKGQTTGRFLS